MEKTREEIINEANNRIYRTINNLAQRIGNREQNPEAWHLITLETDKTATLSDEWYQLAETEHDPEIAVLYFKAAQAVLVRNGLADGLPFCPLCGKIGTPKHNGAPLIEGNVCETCNNRKVIPARIREAQNQCRTTIKEIIKDAREEAK